MKPFGKTYLIRCKKEEGITKENGIFIINSGFDINDSFWKGFVEEYGTGWSDEEIKTLIPKGTEVIMSYGKNTSDKGGTKLIFGKKVFYVRNEKEILGIIEND